MELIEKEASDGGKIKVFPVGTSIQHKKYPELKGVIGRYEYHSSGGISPIPYYIKWENDSLASKLLGWMFIYGDNDTVELLKESAETQTT